MKNTMVQKLLASSRSRMSSQAGFTLVELMVVVAIIGVLATLAVPQYQRFTAKSRQSEVKISLGAARSALESFRPENGLTACLNEAGYQPSNAQRRYTIGFADMATITFCGPNGNQACNGFSGWNAVLQVCPTASMQFAANAFVQGTPVTTAGNLGTAASATVANAQISDPNSYSIGAAGSVAGNGQVDLWTMDQAGNLVNTNSGI
jgi:type IV pilus assembly protein PilA